MTARILGPVPDTIRRAIANDPRIVEARDEGRDTHATRYWLDLAPGWISDEGTHMVAESTVRDVLASLRRVAPCECEDCAAPVTP